MLFKAGIVVYAQLQTRSRGNTRLALLQHLLIGLIPG